MISEQGAILLATLYPIGLLVVAVEARGTRRADVQEGRSVMAVVTTVAQVAATFFSAWAIVICVFTVSSGVTLDGLAAQVVGWAGAFLAVVVLVALMRLLTDDAA